MERKLDVLNMRYPLPFMAAAAGFSIAVSSTTCIGVTGSSGAMAFMPIASCETRSWSSMSNMWKLAQLYCTRMLLSRATTPRTALFRGML